MPLPSPGDIKRYTVQAEDWLDLLGIPEETLIEVKVSGGGTLVIDMVEEP